MKAIAWRIVDTGQPVAPRRGTHSHALQETPILRGQSACGATASSSIRIGASGHRLSVKLKNERFGSEDLVPLDPVIPRQTKDDM